MLKREFARFVKLSRQVLRLKRQQFAAAIKVTTHSLDQWVGRRGGYKSEHFERIWELLSARGIDPGEIRRLALEGGHPRLTGIMRQLSWRDIAILDVWNELANDERLLDIIEGMLLAANIKPPSKRKEE